MNKQLKNIEMKNDGKDSERFRSMLKTVANVSKEKVKKYEEKRKQKRGSKSTK